MKQNDINFFFSVEIVGVRTRFAYFGFNKENRTKYCSYILKFYIKF